MLNQNIRNCTPFDSHLSGKVIGLLSSLFLSLLLFRLSSTFYKEAMKPLILISYLSDIIPEVS